MNFSHIFIKKPVATLALSLAFIIFGWFAYSKLPVSELPNIEYATITVSASLPGADPSTMAASVATPLEKQFSNIAGITSMSSRNTLGQTSIVLQFDLDRNIDSAAQDVQNAISQASKSLPHEMTTLPSLRKVDPTASPILYLALTADHTPLTTLDEYAETQIGQRLSMINGVAQVLVMGSAKYAVRILLNPEALQARGMGINEAITDIQSLNTHQPSGTLLTPVRSYLLTADGQMTNAANFNKSIIAYINSAPIRIQDIGLAEDSVANDQQATFLDQKRAIILAVESQPNANAIQVIDDVKKILPGLISDLPGNVHMSIFYDRSVFIKAAVSDVKLSLILALLFVAAVILLFLGNISATLISISVLPISLIGTFAFMYLLNESIDTLSLMAMVLAVGFIVDDAIVMIENTVRYLDQGYSKLEASLTSSKEISFTILSMTVSLAAVFLPILFMSGLIGRLFNEFAVVTSISILLSGLVSLTLTPMLCSKFLKKTSTNKKIFPWFEIFFSRTKFFYEQSLRSVINHKHWVLILTSALILGTVFLFNIINKGFIPSEDTGILSGNTQVSIGTPFDQFIRSQEAVVKILLADPNISSVISSVGQSGGAGLINNQGQIKIVLKPKDQRKLNADQIIQELRRKIQVPGIQVFLSNPPAIHVGGALSQSTYQYLLQGSNWESLETYSSQLLDKFKTIPGIRDLNSDLNITDPSIHLHILRSKAASLGVTPTQIETTLYNAYGENQISSIYTAVDEYEVIVELDPKYRNSQNSLDNIYIKSNTNHLVPLSAVASLSETASPTSMNHYGQMPAVILSFDLSPGTSLGNVTQKITAISQATLPADITGSFIGSALSFQQSMNSLSMLLVITIIVIYLVLAILYEHFGHPITILTALPFAGFGALLVLFLFHQELDIFSFVGIIMLVGLVKKNGIMMIDFALEARRTDKLSAKDSIIKACVIRFRPIMMTTVSAIMATLPIAIGIGSGGESRESMGIAVVGGLLFSQILTLYVTPVFYLYIEDWGKALRQVLIIIRRNI